MPASAAKHFDYLETRAPKAREQALMNMLPGLIARAKEVAPGWAAHLKDVDPATVTSRAELAKLPQGRTPTMGDWQAINRTMKKELDKRISLLNRTRSKLDECLGCGCLSLDRCRLYNREDRAGAAGPGPRYVLD